MLLKTLQYAPLSKKANFLNTKKVLIHMPILNQILEETVKEISE